MPLLWPQSWPRVLPMKRQRARFDTGLAVSIREIQDSMRLMAARQIQVTSDLPVKGDGMPYATPREPEDPGVAVWWVNIAGQERVIACDRWDSVRDNMQAINASLKALRGLERWGASEIVKRAFAGFAALPAGTGEETNVTPVPEPVKLRHWRDVFGLKGDWLKQAPPEAVLAYVKTRHRDLMREAHPDVGGSTILAVELNAALDAAELELRGE